MRSKVHATIKSESIKMITKVRETINIPWYCQKCMMLSKIRETTNMP